LIDVFYAIDYAIIAMLAFASSLLPLFRLRCFISR